jgi:predicted AAA+ superfamily ATPase
MALLKFVQYTKLRSAAMEIKRDSYLEQLKIRKDNGMIKIITGIRRCGKSFLLFVLFKKYLLESGVDNDHIIEIALDGIENEELRDPKKCYQYIKDAMKYDQKYYLLLDEVQFMPRFEEVLNSLLRIGNIDVYVTGSNSKFLSSDIVTEFRGRGDEIRIYPLSFAEFYAAFDGDYDDAWEEYMTYGGLPQVTQFSVERQKAEYLNNIFSNVYIRDVVERNRIQNVDEIGTLVDILASAIGAPTNPTKISNTFKSERGINYSNKTISNHIDYLAEAFLISKANRYDIKGRKYVGANLKYYFSDVGLRNARLNFRQQEPTHILENIVYNELLVRGYNVDVGIVDVFAKNSEGKRVHKQLEVDFVVNQGSQRYYIQVAYDMTSEEKQTQELNSFRNIPDSFKKIVIVNGTKKPWRNEEGFVIMGMKYFLLNEDSLEF